MIRLAVRALRVQVFVVEILGNIDLPMGGDEGAALFILDF